MKFFIIVFIVLNKILFNNRLSIKIEWKLDERFSEYLFWFGLYGRFLEVW